MLEMFVLLLILVMMNFSLSFSHPLVLGMGLLMVLLIISSIMVFHGSLFSFCLFMVMVGGVLVVFSYTISLIPYSLKKSMDYSKVDHSSILGVSFVVFLCLGSIFMVLMENGFTLYNLFSEIMYYSVDWGVATVWLSLLLFLVMVFSVSVAGKNKGALVK